VNVLVDTSVWSLALRRDVPPASPEVSFLRRALAGDAAVFTTGVILQELLQGIRGPKGRDAIVARFATLPFLVPDRQDHIDAASLHMACRRKGLQVGTIDVLLAQLCLRHRLTILTTDADFTRIAKVAPLSVWRQVGPRG
jgi:predicted nucleic acid-binding protein